MVAAIRSLGTRVYFEGVYVVNTSAAVGRVTFEERVLLNSVKSAIKAEATAEF